MKVNKETLQGRVTKCTVLSRIVSVSGHEVVHITSTPLSIYSNCAGVIFDKIEEIDSRPATLPKNVCTKEVFL